MSLEQALADNTAAIRELIAAMSNGQVAAPKPAQAPAPASGPATAKAGAAPGKTAAAKTPAAASAETAPAAETAATTPQETVAEGKPAAAASAPATPAASTASSSAPVEYPVLQKAVFALAGKSREAAAAVAASFGVKTFKELPADKWGEALGAVQEKLAELENV
jgi:hypothetical protein